MTGKGASAEERVRDAFERDGYSTWLVRGSHGPADLVALKPFQVCLIQVKSGAKRITHGEWESLRALADRAGAVPVLAEVRRPRAFAARAVITLSRITGAHTDRLHAWPCEPFVLDQLEAAINHHPAGGGTSRTNDIT